MIPGRRPILIAAVTLAAMLAGCGGNSGEATAKAPKTFFGLVSGREMAPSDYERIARNGVRVFRFQLSWAGVQSGPDAPYDWRRSDEIFGRLARQGIRPLPFLLGTPKWVAPNLTTPPIRTAAQRQGWRDFVRAALRRYGPGGIYWDRYGLTNPGVKPKPARTWEVWNEHNIPAFWRPKPDVREYARLLKMTSRAIHRVDKRADIMTGGLFGAPGAEGSILSWRYMKRLYKVKGVKPHIDVVGMHPYSKGVDGVKTQTQKVRRAMVQAGQRRTPMVIDEIGWGSDASSNSLVAKTPQGQATALKRAFRLFLKKRKRWKLRHVIWYQYRDPDPGKGQPACPFCDSAGLLNANGTPKPAWARFTGFSRR